MISKHGTDDGVAAGDLRIDRSRRRGDGGWRRARARRRALLLTSASFVAALIMAMPRAAEAQVVTNWRSDAASNDFNSASNWDNGSPAGNIVRIGSATNNPVTTSADIGVNTLSLNDPSVSLGVANATTLTVTNNLILHGLLSVGAGSTLISQHGDMFVDAYGGALSSAGTITLDVGTIYINNATDLRGTVNGALSVGHTTLTLTGALSGTHSLRTTGDYFSWPTYYPQSTVDLNGNDFTAAGLRGDGGTITNNGATAATLTADFDTSALQFDGTIADGTGALALTKAGTGTLTLTRANTYSGATAINGGTLALSGAGSIASSSGVTLAGTGALDISGLAGSGTTINSLSSAAAGTSVVLGDKALTVGDGNTTTFAGVIGGTGSLIKQGSGSLVLTGGNTYTGDTVINGGTIEVRGGMALSDSTRVVLANTAGAGLVVTNTETIGSLSGGGTSGGNVSVASGQSLYIANGGGNTFGGVVSGAGTLRLQAGTLTLTGASTITGSVLPTGGSTLVLSGDGSLAAARVQFGPGSTLDISGVNGSGTSFRAIHASPSDTRIVLGSKTLSFGGNPVADQKGSNYAFSGTISGTGGITLTSGGYRLNGNNTYTGATTVDGGILWLLPSTNTSIASSSGVVLNGSGGLSFALAGHLMVPQIKTLTSSSANSSVDLGGVTLNLTAANSSFAGVISGTGGLLLSAGTETLTGINTYTGATTIDGGTLALAGAGSIAASSGVTLNGTGVFDISGLTAGTTVAALAGSAASTVNLGANALTFGGASTVASRLTGSGGSLVVTGGTVALQNNGNDFSGGVTIGSGGTLRIEADNAAGTGTITTTGSVIDYADGVTVGNAVDVNSNTTQFQVTTGTATQAGAIGETAGPRPIEKIGAGTLVLSGTNTFTGDATVSAGVLDLRNGAALADAVKVTLANVAGTGLAVTDSETIAALAGGGTTGGTVSIADGRVLTLAAGGGNTFAGTITGLGALALTGGIEILSGSNTYSGGTTIGAGATVQVASDNALGTGTLANAGTVDLRDGTAGNRTLTVGGYTGSGAATVRVDIDRSAGATGQRADRLVVAGSGSSGATVVSFTDVAGTTPGLFATPITVVTDAGNATYTATGLTPYGLIRYAFGKVGVDWQVSSSLSPSASGSIAASTSAAMTAITTGFAEPASAYVPAPLDPVQDQLSLGLWTRAKAGRYDITSATTTTGVTAQSKFRTNFDGFQVGIDGAISDIGGSGWSAHLGVTAGDVRVFAADRLSDATSKAGVDAPFFGLYGALVGDGYFLDAQIQRNWYDIRLTAGSAGISDQKVAAQGWSVQTSAGRTIPLGAAWFVEPSVGLNYTTASIGAVPTPAAMSVGARDIDSLIGSARLRVGTRFAATDKLILNPSVQASVWREFAGNATAVADGAGFSNEAIVTTRVGTFGQLGLAITAQSVDTGLSGFVRGDLSFGDKIAGGSVTAGLRYQF